MSEDPVHPPSVAPTPTLMKRCKLLWRILLISNFALGAYIFETKRKGSMENHGRTVQKLKKVKTIVEVPPEPITSSIEDLNYDDFLAPGISPVQVRAPIPEKQQHEIFQWMLEEKRKLKPKDRAEKKQIDEDKAILKQFLRANSIPKF